MVKSNLVISNNAYERDNTALTNAIILNHSQEQAMPYPKEVGGFYVNAVAKRTSRPQDKQYYLFYDNEQKELYYTEHTYDDYTLDVSHNHVQPPPPPQPLPGKGNNGEVQLSAGYGILKSHPNLTYDDTAHELTIGNSTMHTFVMDATTGKFTSGKLRPHAGKQDFEVDHSNLYLHLLDSYALGGTTPLHTGYSVRSQAFTNVSQGLTSRWNTTPQFMQMSTSLGHDRKSYSAFKPLMDSILNTASNNKGKSLQSMDLGSSSRIPRAGGYRSGSSAVTSLWEGNDDNIYRSDSHANTSYPHWDGQIQYKLPIPGLHVEERRWNMVVARETHQCTVHLRSDDAPLYDPQGNSVKGIDFYDHVVGRLESKTYTDKSLGAGVKVSRYHHYSEMGLSLSKNLASGKSSRGTVAGDLIKLSTQAPGALAGYQSGVDFTSTSLGVWGGSHIHLAQYDSTYGHALASHILLDGAGAEIKALNKIESGVLGGTGVGGSSTYSSSLNQGLFRIADAQKNPQTLFQVEGSHLGCELKINDTNAKSAIILRSHTGNAQGTRFKYYEQTEGLFYLSGSIAATNGINSDRVGLMNLTHKHISVSGVDILQINSDFDLAANYPSGLGTHLINCRCSTHLGHANGSVFSIDVAGKFHSQTDQDHAGATFLNTRASIGGKLLTNAILTAETKQRHTTPKYYYDSGGTAQGGYAYIECKATNLASNLPPVRFTVDGDGSMKCTNSVTVHTDHHPQYKGGNSGRSLTLVAGANAMLTTKYSSLPAELTLQSHGPDSSSAGSGFTYTNMVKVVPNDGQKACCFKLENASNPNNLHENFLFLTRETDVGTPGALFMRACPKVQTGALHATFEIMYGGTVGSKQAYIIRSYPEGLSSAGPNQSHLIVGDERALKVQLQGGKIGAKGLTAHTQGGAHAEMIDCNKLDVEHIDVGDSTGALRLGHGLTQDVHLSLGGGIVSCGSGHIDLGSQGHIRCSNANSISGSNGNTNICAKNHNGYMGTHALTPSNGTGLRCYSIWGTIASSLLKAYIALNEAPKAEGTYVVASSIEGPQATVFIRGQVKLQAGQAQINLDTATVVSGIGTLLVPHQVENGWTPGTFGAMFQNPTVHVSNAGILASQSVIPPKTLDFSPDFRAVHGKITLTEISGSYQAILEIQSNPTGGTSDIVVNYIVTAERKDQHYLNKQVNPFVRDYHNMYTGTQQTWGGEHTKTEIDHIFGQDTATAT